MPKKTKNIKFTDKNKSWNKQPMKRYNEGEPNKTSFLIICEGQNTEPQYFRQFPVKTAEVISYGLGSSRTKLVEMVIDLKTEDKQQEVWVVFDMDIQRENADQEQVIQRTNKLSENQKDLNYAEKNPSTSVHHLVNELNKHF